MASRTAYEGHFSRSPSGLRISRTRGALQMSTEIIRLSFATCRGCPLFLRADRKAKSNKIARVWLDFCCKWSVAVGDGSCGRAPPDRTPRLAGLSGVEVVRQGCRPFRRSLCRELNQSQAHVQNQQKLPKRNRSETPVPYLLSAAERP